jgi:hypothetical protein
MDSEGSSHGNDGVGSGHVSLGLHPSFSILHYLSSRAISVFSLFRLQSMSLPLAWDLN